MAKNGKQRSTTARAPNGGGRARRPVDGDGRSRAWTIVSFDDLEAWRQRQHLPKKRVADLLGVTNSTYHNWARGIAVATPATQQRIFDLIRGGAARAVPARTNGIVLPAATHHNGAGEVEAVLTSTAQIVNAYLIGTRPDLDTEQLCTLIREVSRALRP